MKKGIIALISISLSLCQALQGQVYKEKPQQHVDNLTYVNQQIESLNKMKEYYKAKATRNRNRADRLQFQNYYEESRALTAQADEYDEIVSRIDEELKLLETQRDDLINLQSSQSE